MPVKQEKPDKFDDKPDKFDKGRRLSGMDDKMPKDDKMPVKEVPAPPPCYTIQVVPHAQLPASDVLLSTDRLVLPGFARIAVFV